MPDNASSSGPPFRPRFQFSLAGLFIVVFATAAGLSVARLAKHDWQMGPLAALCVPLVLGLWCQGQDFRRAAGCLEGLNSNDRQSWRLEALWRQTVALLLVGHFLVFCLERMQILVLPEWEGGGGPVSFLMRSMVPGLFVVTILLLGRPYREETPRSFRQVLLAVISGLAAACLCLMLWSQRGVIPFLVRTAVVGIETSMPLRFALPGLSPYPELRAQHYLAVALGGVSLLLFNLVVLLVWARQWKRNRWRRWAWGGLLAVGILLSAVGAYWLLGPGLEQLSPCLVDGQPARGVYLWLTAFVLVATLAAIGAYRLARVRHYSLAPLPFEMLRIPRYYHEQRLWLVGLALGMLFSFAQIIQFCFTTSFISWRSGLEILPEILLSQLQLPLLILAIGSAMDVWRHGTMSCRARNAVAVERFLVLWPALTLVLVAGIPAIAALSMIGWAAPTWLLPW